MQSSRTERPDGHSPVRPNCQTTESLSSVIAPLSHKISHILSICCERKTHTLSGFFSALVPTGSTVGEGFTSLLFLLHESTPAKLSELFLLTSSSSDPMQRCRYCSVVKMRSLWFFLKDLVASFPATALRTEYGQPSEVYPVRRIPHAMLTLASPWMFLLKICEVVDVIGHYEPEILGGFMGSHFGTTILRFHFLNR
jgi:hypothetical protein